MLDTGYWVQINARLPFGSSTQIISQSRLSGACSHHDNQAFIPRLRTFLNARLRTVSILDRFFLAGNQKKDYEEGIFHKARLMGKGFNYPGKKDPSDDLFN